LLLPVLGLQLDDPSTLVRFGHLRLQSFVQLIHEPVLRLNDCSLLGQRLVLGLNDRSQLLELGRKLAGLRNSSSSAARKSVLGLLQLLDSFRLVAILDLKLSNMPVLLLELCSQTVLAARAGLRRVSLHTC
jgi:hypothetical protein